MKTPISDIIGMTAFTLLLIFFIETKHDETQEHIQGLKYMIESRLAPSTTPPPTHEELRDEIRN